MYFLQLLWLYLPAFAANATPVLAAAIPVFKSWNTPIHARWFGKNKTWRGLVCGTCVAGVTGLVQYALKDISLLHSLYLLSFSAETSFFMGLALGFGALAGDCIKSFLKRRIGIAPGQPWPVLDGIDYMVGAIIALLPWYQPTPFGILFLVVMGPIASSIANALSFMVGWKKVWW
ncbi:MAG: hypothetical protein JWM56_1243 [Candidatus Peribacteria bacterium]|nr:hypothetical protein [Candidatus Peribacteria bacterium]